MRRVLANSYTSDRNTVLTPPVPGFGLWLKADAINQSDNTSVSLWPDSSSSVPPNDASSAIALQPIFRTNQLNGLPGVLFGGTPTTTDYLSVPKTQIETYTEGEVFCLFKNELAVPVDGQRSGFWDFGSDINAEHIPFTDGNMYSEFGTITRRNIGAPGPTFNLALPTMLNIITSSAQWTANFNRTLFFTTATNTVGFAGPSAYRVGGSFSGFTGDVRYFGTIFEIILYPFVHTPTQRNDTIDYFNTKWGTTF
jgi:hypothetical protein